MPKKKVDTCPRLTEWFKRVDPYWAYKEYERTKAIVAKAAKLLKCEPNEVCKTIKLIKDIEKGD